MNIYKGCGKMKSIKSVISLIIVFYLQNAVMFCSMKELPLYFKIIMTFLSLFVYLAVNIHPNNAEKLPIRLKAIKSGCILLSQAAFLAILQTAAYIYIAAAGFNMDSIVLAANIVIALLLILIMAVNGTLRILFTSTQLGVIRRIIFIICWWIPIINILLLHNLYMVAKSELRIEKERYLLDEARKECEICKTRYPVLMVHGVFFRDTRYFNYWGRIPKELKKNGADIFYGSQQSALTVKDSAQELKDRILAIIKENNCDKVNIIAHSKGGLDARYAISCLGMGKYVASLTTINTPHRGCSYADFLLSRLPGSFVRFVSKSYNNALIKLGEESPDFYGAVSDLTAKNCAAINEAAEDCPGVVYQSITSKLKSWRGAMFPLNIFYLLAKRFEGDNDGLVSVESAKWGRFIGVIEPKQRQGISHGDVIDLNRKNINDFDVCELYVNILKELKENNL